MWRLVEHTDFHICLVDYSCPERCGDWLEREFPETPAGRRVVVERVPGCSLFNKSRAHNAGAMRALRGGAEYLCFVDADTMIHPGFARYVRQNAGRDRFLIAGLGRDGFDMPSMTGLLVVRAEHFSNVGCFDEQFEGWGGEDIEMRLRLYYVGGLGFGDVPLVLANPIAHDNHLRTQFYEESSIFASNRANMRRVQEKLASWGAPRRGTGLGADRLWYLGSGGSQGAALAVSAPRPRHLRGEQEHPIRSVARRLGRGPSSAALRVRGR